MSARRVETPTPRATAGRFVGRALRRTEDFRFVTGRGCYVELLTGTLADYAMPAASAFPRIDAVTLEETPSALNPLGAKGAGEGGIVAIGAAAANAVAAALAPLGVVVHELPLSATNIARWIREARRAG